MCTHAPSLYLQQLDVDHKLREPFGVSFDTGLFESLMNVVCHGCHCSCNRSQTLVSMAQAFMVTELTVPLLVVCEVWSNPESEGLIVPENAVVDTTSVECQVHLSDLVPRAASFDFSSSRSSSTSSLEQTSEVVNRHRGFECNSEPNFIVS